jgi:hypothetical protein
MFIHHPSPPFWNELIKTPDECIDTSTNSLSKDKSMRVMRVHHAMKALLHTVIFLSGIVEMLQNEVCVPVHWSTVTVKTSKLS